MNRFVQALALLLLLNTAFAQTPVPMASQIGLSYTEDFADIANWTNNFAAGIGANRFAAVAINATGTIPDGVKTTVSTAAFTTASSGGVQKGTENIVLLSTGTSPENSNACAFDFLLDFTGVIAGTLSFDWASVNNSSGDRKASLRVYTSTNGITWTELTGAAVLNITNNVSTSGSIINIALPGSFNGSSSARIRFYEYNGTGGTTGSRPKISIDNLNVTAISPCTSPSAQPTNLSFGTVTGTSIDGSFTAASPAPNAYLVVISNNNSLASLPVDGINYNLGDNIGDGYVIANGNSLNFSATGLSSLTTYYFYIFSVNNLCSGGIKYLSTSPLIGNNTTLTGLPACTTPTAQPTNLTFGTATVNSIPGSFTAAAPAADGYLVLRSTSSSLTSNPINGVLYNTGDIIGNAIVVKQNNLTSFTATGLTTFTTYYFYIFSYNALNCSNGPAYYTVTPLSGSKTTANLSACVTPASQPTNLSFTIARNAIAGSFTAGSGNDTYLVIRSLNPTLSASPVNNTDYSVGSSLGGGIVIDISANKSFITNNLVANTSYYFYVFAANKLCSGGTKYLTVNPLTGNATTTNDPVNNYYFGNLHAHSDYSDGNKDNPGYTPEMDYADALNAQCMDYLGISEHNHYSGNNSPGNKLSTYGLGITQANNFNTANPGFVALYGMEWGVISNGGHVLIYGDGMNNLWGWETGSGGWGTGNNYNILVEKNDYNGANGLFKTVNDNIGSNTFATLAHPNSNDFGNLSNITYSAVADDAISGTAVESGPAFSTNITYNDPGTSMSHLSYYQKMLSKGYHLGPTIDHDNHYTTFGKTTYSRSAVVAPVLTKTEIIKGFRNIHFYATQDCDTKVDFTLNTKIMGSTVIGPGTPVISVTITDATTVTSGAIIRLMYGVPGSGTNAVKIDSAIGSTLTFVDNNLANNVTGYYYIDITNGSKRIVTAPVWYTRVDGALPVTFGSFTIQKINNAVKLNWTTEQEINSSHFIIERSADGRTWKTVASIAATGNSSNQLTYNAFDNLPLNGTGYYRIKQVDIDGKYLVSVVRNISFDLGYMVSIAPNPAKDFINITFDKTNSTNSLIQFFDAAGNLVLTEKTNQQVININTMKLGRGLYFIKVSNAGLVSTQKLLLQ